MHTRDGCYQCNVRGGEGAGARAAKAALVAEEQEKGQKVKGWYGPSGRGKFLTYVLVADARQQPLGRE